MLAAAYELAPRLAAGADVPARSLFDLKLGETALWTITERAAQTTAADGREERYAALLPAWSADSRHDLSDPGLGFESAAHALDPWDPWEAAQAAMARYTRVGFEASAVTALAIALSMPRYRAGVVRHAELRFAHPYAVVAVTTDDDRGPGKRRGREGLAWRRADPTAPPGPWHGMPVFSAWVADPDDASDT